jgi:EXS family
MSSTQTVGEIFGSGSGGIYDAMLRSPTVLIASIGLWGMNVYVFKLFSIDYVKVLTHDLLKLEEQEQMQQQQQQQQLDSTSTSQYSHSGSSSKSDHSKGGDTSCTTNPSFASASPSSSPPRLSQHHQQQQLQDASNMNTPSATNTTTSSGGHQQQQQRRYRTSTITNRSNGGVGGGGAILRTISSSSSNDRMDLTTTSIDHDCDLSTSQNSATTTATLLLNDLSQQQQQRLEGVTDNSNQSNNNNNHGGITFITTSLNANNNSASATTAASLHHHQQQQQHVNDDKITASRLIGWSVVLLFLLHTSYTVYMTVLHGSPIGAILTFYTLVTIVIIFPILPNTRWLRIATKLVLERIAELFNPRWYCCECVANTIRSSSSSSSSSHQPMKKLRNCCSRICFDNVSNSNSNSSIEDEKNALNNSNNGSSSSNSNSSSHCSIPYTTTKIPRPIPFIDVFFADAMCSLSKVFFDWGMLFHMAMYYPNPVPISTYHILIPSTFAAVPYMIRARQCIIMWHVCNMKKDHANKYQHLWNALKYATSIFPLLLSAYQKTIMKHRAHEFEPLLLLLLIINASYALWWDIGTLFFLLSFCIALNYFNISITLAFSLNSLEK